MKTFVERLTVMTVFFGISLAFLLPVDVGYSQTVSFSPATNFAAGSNPFSIAIGDLNGDGKPDLAVANVNSNNVSILLGDGTGSFGPATNFAVGTNPESVAIGDFNGDGKPDLAVANIGSDSVSILLGDGTGAFGPAANFAVGTNPESVAIGDLNGDGKADLAVANIGNDTVSILLGDGTGSFGPATNFAVGAGPLSVAIGKLNGDGEPDLAVVNFFGDTVSILLGDGTGAFGPATNFAVGTNPESVAIGDLNGDGKADLAVANIGSDTVSILLGDGTGAFGPATNFAVGAGPLSVAIGDLNGDGMPDLAVANLGSSTVSILLNSPPVETFMLSVSKAGSGGGAVTSGPAGINCGADCSEVYNSGLSVKLTATPDATSTFTGWSGACSGTGTCVVTMDAAKSVMATFMRITFTLTVSRTGAGSGTVTSSPAGINCGATCTGTYNGGTVIKLTATAPLGSVFAGFSGGCVSSGSTCTLTLSGTTTVTATFNSVPTYTLSVSKAGSGGGTVTSSPAGINCGATCSGTYNNGTVVTLTATPDATSILSGWSGACTGTGICTVTMDSDKSVTATFAHVIQPDLIMTSVAPNAATVNAGAALSVTNTVTNQGASSGVFRIAYHLSVNTIYGDADDVVIPTIRVVTSLGAGASNTATTGLSIPSTAPGGTYFLCAVADSVNQVAESKESNNMLCSPSTVTVPQPDLIISALSKTATTVKAGGTVTVSNTIKNQGGSKDTIPFVVAFHLSADATYGGGDDIALTTTRTIGSLGEGATSSATNAVHIPASTPPGSYFICAKADDGISVAESDKTNNTACTATTVTVPPADLVMTALSKTATTVTAGGTFAVSDAVKNQGSSMAGAFAIGFVLSANNIIGEGDDIALTPQRSLGGLGVGLSSGGSTTVTVPDDTAPGIYYIGAIADINGTVAEGNESNNTRLAAGTITVTQQEGPR